MALASHLQNQMTPSELELIATEHLVDIVPLISMERTAFISVSIKYLSGVGLILLLGCIRPLTSSSQMQGTRMDGGELETQAEMSCCASRLAQCRYMASLICNRNIVAKHFERVPAREAGSRDLTVGVQPAALPIL
jgi:hypothetical protein